MAKLRATADIPFFSTRQEYFDFFRGLTVRTAEELEGRQLSAGLQKSYLVETLGQAEFDSVLSRSNLTTEHVPGDEDLRRVTDAQGLGTALIERVNQRYSVFYTLLPSQQADSLVRKAVASNPKLDHLWLSSATFMQLWRHIRQVNPGRRYGKITFEHEALYEKVAESQDEMFLDDERRNSRFTMVDQLDAIDENMPALQQLYTPLSSVTHLRIPSSGRGGHELYHDGKATNRSASFLDHRNSLLQVVGMYSVLTERVEEALWVDGAGVDGGGSGTALETSVAELVFSSPLSEETFKRWVISMFNNRRNRFRISGHLTWLSDLKVHANAIDQHLWQTMLLELTNRRIVVVLPRGTCGNIINRLVSNVQRFLDPNVSVYVGAAEYASLIPAIPTQHAG